MSVLIDIASWMCLLAGGFFAMVGGLGLLRMPDFFTRMHAAGITDTVGAGLILAGLGLQAGFSLVTAKLAILGLLLLFANPTATHALANAALVRGLKPLLGKEKRPSKS